MKVVSALLLVFGLVVCGETTSAMPPFNTPWYSSYSPDVNLSLRTTTTSNALGGYPYLHWDSPKHFSAIFSYLQAPIELKAAGDHANLTIRWRSTGANECPASCYAGDNYCQSDKCQKLKCVSKSVNCLGGTGDFRIALLDTTHATAAPPISANNWCPSGVEYKNMTKCLEAQPFADMRGYDFRIFPHLTKDAKHEPGQVPCSIYRKSSPNLFGKSPRLGEWGCFGAPLGEWTTLSLVISRTGVREFTTSMKMNGIKYEAKDQIDPADPTAISRVDAIAIGYPNGRDYGYVDMASITLGGSK